MILQSVKCSCCRQHLSSLSNLTVFLEEVCFVYCLRKGSRLEKVPEWCYSGMLPRNVWVKVAVQGCSCTGPALPAWQCLSNKRCKVFGWVFKGPSVIAPCYGQQRVWSRWLICRGAGGWTAELHHSCNACCSGAVADSDPAQCMQLLALKTQTWCCMCSLHSAYPRDFRLEIWLLKLTLPVVRQLCQSFVYSWSIACLWMNFWNILRMLTCS